MFIVKRNHHNPIIKPNVNNYWEAVATFNWSPIKLGDKYHVFYRAMAKPDYMHGPNVSLSTIGSAESTDGVHFENHKQLIFPDNEWEIYGCEDPRATTIDNVTYIFYTALSVYPFSHEGIKVACAITDDCKYILQKHLVTPFNAKAMTLFPEKINGKYVALLTVHPDRPPASICIAEFDNIEDIWSQDYWRNWYAGYKDHEFQLTRKDTEHVEIGATPIKTDRGWLLIYSHIYNYFSENKKFGIEALLLDLNDPRKILGRTNYPFLVPETTYEIHGEVPNIVFPSGAVVEFGQLKIFYGGADTVCCLAEVNLEHLLDSLEKSGYKESAKRYEGNPIISPNPDNDWESYATFNPAAIELDGKVHILYRAMGRDNTSVMGYASSKNGKKLDERLNYPIYTPRADFESKKKEPDGYSGCEDPRVTLIDDRLYMLYTAYDGINPPSIAITGINQQDFLNKVWNWDFPRLMSPVETDDKDACFFPEKIEGNYVGIHRMNSVICIDFFESMNFEKQQFDRCIQLFGPRQGMWDGLKVGVSCPPIKTDHGWLLLYHGVSDDAIYRVGAALLELNNPANTISRTADYIFEPKEKYENEGQVSHVVFPCGAVIRDNTLYMYYGGGDSVIGVATIDMTKLLDALLF